MSGLDDKYGKDKIDGEKAADKPDNWYSYTLIYWVFMNVYRGGVGCGDVFWDHRNYEI